MKSKVIERADATILEIQGKITIGEGDIALRKAFNDVLDNGAKNVILDLSGLKYIDSSGIGELVACHKSITNNGGNLRLTNLQSRIYSLLQLTALISVFDIYDSIEDALQSLSS